MTTRKVGEKFGCNDQGVSNRYTHAELSRVLDMLDACRVVSEDARLAAFKALPDGLKVDFNYSKWTYTL